jgi:urea transport system substrate-binding protein
MGGAAATAGILGAPALVLAADTVKIGIVAPITGLSAILGETLVNCYKLAADTINAGNGIGGRKVELIIEDSQTNTRGAVDKTRKLIGSDKVDVIMGGLLGLERAGILSVSSKAKKLYFFPTYSQGGVCDPYYVATGQIPNQQIAPAMPFIAQNLGKKIYIMGSDYEWPRATSAYIQSVAAAHGCTVVAEDYFPFGTQDFGPAFQKIRDLKPDVIWSMVVGNDLVAAVKQHRSFDIKQALIAPIDEVFVKDALPGGLAKDVYSMQSYFMQIDSPENRNFVKAFQGKFGADKAINSISEAAFTGMLLYAAAANKAASTKDDAVLRMLGKVEVAAPQGTVRIDPNNNHMLCNSILGQARADGAFNVLKNFGKISPEVNGCKLI